MATAHVLLASNDTTANEAINNALTQAKHAVSVVDTTSLLLDSLKISPAYDIVLLDNALCCEDVPKICSQIRAMPAGANCSIILLAETGAIPSDSCHTVEGLVDGYLSKPIDKLCFCAWINAVMRLRALQAELSRRMPEGQSDKDAVVEAFASLSHTVNNPLQALYATVDMLLLNYPDDEKIADLASNIFTHAEKVARAVTQASTQAKQFLKI